MIALIILAVLITYLTVTILVTVAVTRRARSTGGKWLVALSTIAVFVLIPTWDEIIGRYYFRHICREEGGEKIYKTVKLPFSYFDRTGRPDFKFSKKPGVFLELAERYATSNEPSTVSRRFRIEKNVIVVKDTSTAEILGTHTYYLYFGGWFVNSTGLHVTGENCPTGSDAYYGKFYADIFKPAEISK